MKKRIGIIGFGEMGKRHAKEINEATGGLVELAGVYEPHDLNYRKGCEWIEAEPKRYDSLPKMIAKAKLDGIIIASPNTFHLDNLNALEGREFTILIEKPLDVDVDKISAIARFAAKYKGGIIVDHVMRYAPIVRRAKQIIDDGLLGKVCSFHFIQRHAGGALFHTFRRSLKGGGGQMLEKATHDLDVMLFLTNATPRRVASIGKQQVYGGNKPNNLHCTHCAEKIYCISATHAGKDENADIKDVSTNNDLCPFAREVDVFDNETSLIELDNNIFGTYSHCYFTETKYSREYEIIGSKGTMTISFSGNPDGKLMYFPRGKSGEIQEYKFNYSGKIHYFGGKYIGLHFYDVMCGREKPFSTVNQAFVAEMLACAAMEAQKKKTFVNVEDIIPGDLKKTYNSIYATSGAIAQ